MSGMQIPIKAAFDGGDVNAVVEQFRQNINQLGEAIAKANRLKFNPIDKASIQDFNRIKAQYETLLKLNGDLRKRVSATGQRDTSFDHVKWDPMYPDAHSRARQMLKHFSYVVGDGRFVQPSTTPGTAPGGTPGGGGSGGGRPPQAPPPSPWSSVPGQVLGAGLNAVGPAGGVASRALSAGMSGGMGAGLAGLVGGMAALALGKAVGAVMGKVGDAQQELIAYDTLKRTLGDVNVSFGVLRDTLRSGARVLDMTFDESQRLGQQFAKLSGMSGDQSRNLADEVVVGGGFGRSFGMDPAQANAFFGQMRQFGVTRDTQGSRELALMIAESIARSGTFSKADEVLEAIAGYTTMQTRAGMNTANAGAYAEMLSGMMGSGIPGMDPRGAAALLGQVNASIAGGGAAGEAGQNFFYSALGSRLGLSPIQAALLREQGAFGTGASTFGKGSLYGSFAAQHGLATPGAAGSTATNLQMVMEQFQKNYRGRPELMVDAMSRLFGTNLSQSMALSMIQPEQLGGLSNRLKRLGVNINDVSATGISRLAQIEADGSLSAADKDRMVKEAATQNQEETEGSKTRATINGVERAVQEFAGRAVPLFNDMRAGIMWMAGEKGVMSPRQIKEALLQSESKDRVGQINSQFETDMRAAGTAREAARQAQRDLLEKNRGKVMSGEMTQEEHAKQMAVLQRQERDAEQRLTAAREKQARALEEEAARLRSELDGLNPPTAGGGRGFINPEAGAHAAAMPGARTISQVASGGGAFDDDAGAEGLTPQERALAASIYQQETSGGGNTTTSINGAVGHMQMLPSTFNAFADKGWDINNPSHNRRAAMRYIRHLLKKSGGNMRTAAGGYYGGEGAIAKDGSLKLRRNKVRPSDPSTWEYADEVMGRIPDVGRQPPGGDGANVNVTVGGTFQLNGPNGQPAAPPLQVNTRVGVPMQPGAR